MQRHNQSSESIGILGVCMEYRLTITRTDRRGSHNNTNNRLQRRISNLQEPQFQRLGKPPFLLSFSLL
jgi:hypothetical protein